MNPIFVFLVIVGLIGSWFLLYPIFPKIGKFLSWAYEQTIESLNEEE